VAVAEGRQITKDDRERARRDRRLVFWLQIVYLLALAALAVLYFTDTIKVRHFVGTVPTAVPWFGALGAVLISLTGVFTWCENWDVCYRYWHWSRPLIGASVGVIAVLIFQAGIVAAGSEPKGTTDVPKNLIYYLVAFLVGYREATFRELIKRLTDVLLTPDGTTTVAPPTISLLNPSSGPQSGGTSVIVIGAGLTGAQEVKFGAHAAQFSVDSDAQVTAISPPSGTTGPVAVAVTTPTGTASGPLFTYTTTG